MATTKKTRIITVVNHKVITEADIDVLRPALGIPPKFKSTIIGKTVNKDIPANDPIFWARWEQNIPTLGIKRSQGGNKFSVE